MDIRAGGQVCLRCNGYGSTPPNRPRLIAPKASAGKNVVNIQKQTTPTLPTKQWSRKQQPLPVVILPGFGNATRDYVAPFGKPDDSLTSVLLRRGIQSFVVPIERKDWFRVGRMAITMDFYRGQCTTHPGYSWYLERVKETVNAAVSSSGSDKVLLVGHSAGGWLARAFIGQVEYREDGVDSDEEDPHQSVAGLVTLGTPHFPPPALSKVKCMTGGALGWVNDRWPGAYYASKGVSYVCVTSSAIKGDQYADKRSLAGYSAGSYRQVAGSGHGVEGDAVVPMHSALLEGAEHVILREALHSMSRVRTFEEPAVEPWYGSDCVIDEWLDVAMQAVQKT